VLNYASNTNSVYLNGQKVATAATSANQSALAVNEGLGSNFFNGTLDEVRIESSARSESWIDVQYKSQKDALLGYQPEERLGL